MDGWIKIYRKLRYWEWYKNSSMVHLFIHLLMSANRKPGEWMGVTIERGQVITGRNKLSEQTGISQQSIRTCLRRLESTNEITIISTNQYSIITICKYEDYQPVKRRVQPTDQPVDAHQSTTNKNIENKRNQKRYIVPPRIEWVEEYCNERNIMIDPQHFFDNNESKGWMIGSNMMKDWEAAIRNWERNGKLKVDSSKRSSEHGRKHQAFV